jgi:hypothetical protein
MAPSMIDKIQQYIQTVQYMYVRTVDREKRRPFSSHKIRTEFHGYALQCAVIYTKCRAKCMALAALLLIVLYDLHHCYYVFIFTK